MKKILFLHGFTSCGQCAIAQTLADALKGWAEIIAPDLPIHPYKALELVRDVCHTKHPDLMVGSSCGAFYAQQLVKPENIPAILINPYFQMSEFLRTRIGIGRYKGPRRDGIQEFEVTPSLIEAYKEMEKWQFVHYDPSYRNKVWGLFGKRDTLAHFRDVFTQYYPETRDFDGNHTIEPENVRLVLAPMIKEMMEDVETSGI